MAKQLLLLRTLLNKLQMDKILAFLTRDKKTSYQVVVTTLPLFLYLSYSLYHRVLLEEPTPTPELRVKSVKK